MFYNEDLKNIECFEFNPKVVDDQTVNTVFIKNCFELKFHLITDHCA